MSMVWMYSIFARFNLREFLKTRRGFIYPVLPYYQSWYIALFIHNTLSHLILLQDLASSQILNEKNGPQWESGFRNSNWICRIVVQALDSRCAMEAKKYLSWYEVGRSQGDKSLLWYLGSVR